MNTRTVLALALLCQLHTFTPGAKGQVYEKVLSFTDTSLPAVNVGAGPDGLVQGADGRLYGVTFFGGDDDNGTIFRIEPSGTLTTISQFTTLGGTDGGILPRCVLAAGADGNFYGTAQYGGGGENDAGTIFRVTPSGIRTTLVTFDITNGGHPFSGLIRARDGTFYGTTTDGGAARFGTIYRMTAAGALTTLVEFGAGSPVAAGFQPNGGLVEAADGNLYGTTAYGGANGKGTIFKLTPAGVFTTLVEFTGNGAANKGATPFSALIQASDGNFYGATTEGGANNAGTIFKMTPAGALTTLVEFTGTAGAKKGGLPRAALIQLADGNLYGSTARGGALDFGTMFRVSTAGAFTTLVEFSGNGAANKGREPRGPLVLSTDGNLYGTTFYGGRNDQGTVFRLTTAGALTTMVEFTGTAGNAGKYLGALTLGSDGRLYGTASTGGPSGRGVAYRATLGGELTVLASFGPGSGNSGDSPRGLAEGSDGKFYGVTNNGGIESYGTVYRMTSAGAVETLLQLTTSGTGSQVRYPETEMIRASDGNLYGVSRGDIFGNSQSVYRVTPQGAVSTLVQLSGDAPFAALLQASDGNFYGTRFGQSADGSLYRVTPGGTLSTLVQFSGNGTINKGSEARGRLIQGTDGNLYGTTARGGTSNFGTVFRCALGGSLTTLVNFTGNGASNKGATPEAGLVQALDGNFYGTTAEGGTGNLGTVFQMTPAGVLTTIFDFAADPIDSRPGAALVVGSDGNLYGTASGGNNGAGSIFRVVLSGAPSLFPLEPENVSTSGAVVVVKASARGSGTTVVLESGNAPDNLPTQTTVTSGLTGHTTTRVGVTLGGFQPGETVYYRFRASNAAGQTLSPVQSFSTLAPPVVAVGVATEVTPTSAKFNGTVNARNFGATAVFEWGNDGFNFPNVAPAVPGTVTGNTPVAVSAAVVVPQGSTVYFRIRATNAGGTATTGTRGFNTGLGVTTTAAAQADIGVTEMTFRATVNTFGQTAAVKFKYWADSAPGVVFETATQAVTSNGPTEVSARVTGLLENVAYSYRVSVELAGTETDGGAVAFTTDTNQPPSAVNDLVFYSGQVVVDPLANDSDPNDGSNVNLLLAPALVVAPDASRGVASVTNDRRGISYNPQFNVLDDDALTYRVVDPLGASADGQVRLIAFSKRAGLYGGKIVSGGREGTIAVQVGGGGAISTSFLNWGGESFRLKGVFDQRGRFTRTLNSPGGAVLTITLALDADAPRMLGTFEERVNEVSTTGEIAFVLTKDANTGGLAESGLRTGFLSPPSAQAGVMADGYLRMTVGKDARRGARFAGRLPDGEPFLTGARAQGRTYSLARALEQGGVFTGLVRAIDGSAGAGGMMGNLLWQKRASSRARYERGGVSSVLSLSGVAYPALERGALAPLGANVRLILGGVRRGDGTAVSYRDLLMQLVPGSMAAQIVGSDPMQTSGEDIPLTKLQVKVDAVNAAFRGRFLHPATGRLVPFDGALRMPFDGEPVQGRGVFRGPGAAGSVRLEAN